MRMHIAFHHHLYQRDAPIPRVDSWKSLFELARDLGILVFIITFNHVGYVTEQFKRRKLWSFISDIWNPEEMDSLKRLHLTATQSTKAHVLCQLLSHHTRWKEPFEGIFVDDMASNRHDVHQFFSGRKEVCHLLSLPGPPRKGLTPRDFKELIQLFRLDSWVQCERCLTWRKLPSHLFREALPNPWRCALNTWGQVFSCQEHLTPLERCDRRIRTLTKRLRQEERRLKRLQAKRPTVYHEPPMIEPPDAYKILRGKRSTPFGTWFHHLISLSITKKEDKDLYRQYYRWFVHHGYYRPDLIWIQCTQCFKWRKLPHLLDPDDLEKNCS